MRRDRLSPFSPQAGRAEPRDKPGWLSMAPMVNAGQKEVSEGNDPTNLSADTTDTRRRLRTPSPDRARTSARVSRASWPVDVRHLQTRRAQPFPHGAGKTLHQLVAEVVISLAFVSQAPSVDPEHPHEF